MPSPEKTSEKSLQKNDMPELILAPVEGYTDHPFRCIMRGLGFPGLMYTEMINCKNIINNPQKAHTKLFFSKKERPMAVQISGNSPECVLHAARYVEKQYSPDYIDLNAGCPTKRTTRSSSGAALIKDPKRMERILHALCSKLNTPVTVKTRLGWSDPKEIFELVKVFNNSGVSHVAVHLRTRTELFRGNVHRELIRKIKSRLNKPFIVNGNIRTIEDIVEMYKNYNVKRIMIGRGFIANPWLYRQLHQYITRGKYRKISARQKICLYKKHLGYNIKYYGEKAGVLKLRKFIRKYFSSFPDCKQLADKIIRIHNPEKILKTLESFLIQGKTV